VFPPYTSLVSIRQLHREDVEDLFRLADRFARSLGVDGTLARGRIMATLFYEPSTRTRLSFESAMTRLGGGVISTENALRMSSAAKGESLPDTVRIVSGYADVIVLRHFEEGSAKVAAQAALVPVVNAGDGPGEHPTQALLDAYTIRRRLGALEGLHVVLVGDMAYGRTAHSLSLLLANWPGVRITFVAPETARAPQTLLAELRERGTEVAETEDLLHAASTADVLYVTRVQKERFPSPEAYRLAQGRYTVDDALLAALPRRSAILHPLPRLSELPEAVDADPRAAYFEQARNGVPVRMAILARTLGLA
jgi:aspartate carbamoyltransferase catalytic subunit